MTADPSSVRRLAGLRAIWGLLLIAHPRGVLRLGGVIRPGASEVTVTRVLGTRHLVQSVVLAAFPRRAIARLGALADGAHAASAVALAVKSETDKRAWATDACVATGIALTTWLSA